MSPPIRARLRAHPDSRQMAKNLCPLSTLAAATTPLHYHSTPHPPPSQPSSFYSTLPLLPIPYLALPTSSSSAVDKAIPLPASVLQYQHPFSLFSGAFQLSNLSN